MQEELLNNVQAKRITLLGFFVNVVLAVVKIFAGVLGRSAAVIADGVHSLSDFIIDIVVLISIRFTKKPKDKCHNYGHDKIQTLVTAAIGVFLAVLAFQIAKYGIEHIIYALQGNILDTPSGYTLIIVGLCIVTKEILYHYTLRKGKKIGNSTVCANAWHYRADVLSSVGIFLGITGAILLGDKWIILDPIACVIVALLIFKVALGIIKPAFEELIEKSVEKSEYDSIANVFNEHSSVKDYHKLWTRKVGNKIVIDTHILVDKSLDIEQAHDITRDLEKSLRDKFGAKTVITIHAEPFYD